MAVMTGRLVGLGSWSAGAGEGVLSAHAGWGQGVHGTQRLGRLGTRQWRLYASVKSSSQGSAATGQPLLWGRASSGCRVLVGEPGEAARAPGSLLLAAAPRLSARGERLRCRRLGHLSV